MNNPWRVDSIQEFSCLKCPECDYLNKEETCFEDHAISNHPLSVALFDKTKPNNEIEVEVKVEIPDCVDHVTVEDIKKESGDLDSVAEDPLDFCDKITHQEDRCMSLKTGNELPNDKDVPNPKLKPVKQKRKQSHLEIKNDYDEINVFDNESNIQENQPKKPKRKQKIDNNQAPVSISYQIADNNSCRLCDYKTDDRSKLKIHLENHIVAQDPLDFCDTNTHQEEHCMSLKSGNEWPNDKDVPNPKLKPVKRKRKHSHLEIRNDCDEFVAFDNEDKVPRITENQSKKRKRKQIIAARNEFALDEDLQGPVSIKSDSLENQQIACTLCDYKTDDRVKFRNHLGFHLSCDNCGKKFHGKNGRQEMKIHWETHHRFKFVKKPLKLQSDEVPHNFSCSLCNYKSQAEHDFKNHIESTHDKNNCKSLNASVTEAVKEVMLDSQSSISRKQLQLSLKCPKCDFKTSGKCYLDRHIKSHNDPQPLNSRKKLPRSLECTKCDFKASRKHYLDKHTKSHNDCEHCGEVFSGSRGKRLLARHLKIHKIVRTVCDFCNNPYTKHSSLKRHEKTCPKKEEVLRAMETC